ncbi:MAG: hypothetical protein ACOZNI_17530 [Myxococcota bacterium]
MTIEVLAWSGDGQAALVERVDSVGIAWVVIEAAGPREVVLPAEARDCEAAVARLPELVARFEGVRVRPERCHHDRAALVWVDPAQSARVEASWSPEGMRVGRVGRVVRLVREGRKPEPLDLAFADGHIALLAVGPLVLVVETGEAGLRLLGALQDTPAGFAEIAIESAPVVATTLPSEPMGEAGDPFGLEE